MPTSSVVGNDIQVVPSPVEMAGIFSIQRQSRMPRYAIYYAPESTQALWTLASRTIGFDAMTGYEPTFPQQAPFDRPDWAALTEEPRRYGFHATLKAPMELVETATEADLIEAAATFARGQAGFSLEVDIAALKGFLALTPTGDTAAVDALAAACVRDFDCLRAPMSAADRERRLKSPLTPVQIQRMDLWGYPYVFDEFQFHMTLTGRLPPDLVEPVRQALRDFLAPLPLTLPVNAVCVFRQERRDGRFTLLQRFPFGR